VRAYRDTLRLYFLFLTNHLGRSAARLQLEDIRHETVLAFLQHLERDRGNAPATRNCRLAAIHSFVEHLLRHDISRAEQYRRVLAIPMKRAHLRPPAYFEPHEMRTLIAQPPTDTARGLRDLTLLLFLYNTGARVSEALSVKTGDLHLCRPLQVRLHGKGGKDRICPLWPETAQALAALLRRSSGDAPNVFRNARGGPLTRDGVAHILTKYLKAAAQGTPSLSRRRLTPHMLRHSCAMALLQSGVELTVIRDYLGHASVATTGRYLTSNLDMKRRALESFWKRAGLVDRPCQPWRPSANILAFLNSLQSDPGTACSG
jgi:site-specific recombinase XerD